MMQSNHGAPDDGAGCGARLRRARVAAGLTHEEVSARLRVPVRVVRELESDDWSSLGAPVFVRGQLRSYARLFDLDIESELTEARMGVVMPPTLVSHTHTPQYRRMAEQVGRRAIYIAITAAIAVPVWMATRPHLSNSELALQSLDVPVSADAATRAGSASPAVAARTPMVASFGTLPAAPVVSAQALSLSFKGDSWVQIFAADGRPIEQGLLKAGQSRGYAVGEVGRIVLGDSSAVMVERAGKPVDLGPFSRANVARFTLSSDGSLAPASR